MATKRQTREEVLDGDDRKHQHQPAVSNALKIKLDHLRSFDALTENQSKFFSMYKQGGYFIGLFGSPGVGKCLGFDEELEIEVSEDIYKKLQ